MKEPHSFRAILQQDDLKLIRVLEDLISSQQGEQELLLLAKKNKPQSVEWILNLFEFVRTTVPCFGSLHLISFF